MQGQLQRLQNALAASRHDAERRDAAVKHAVAERARAEADAAEARGRLHRSEERCAAARQQLAAACSALAEAGLPLPVAGAVDARACLVRCLALMVALYRVGVLEWLGAVSQCGGSALISREIRELYSLHSVRRWWTAAGLKRCERCVVRTAVHCGREWDQEGHSALATTFFRKTEWA